MSGASNKVPLKTLLIALLCFASGLCSLAVPYSADAYTPPAVWGAASCTSSYPNACNTTITQDQCVTLYYITESGSEGGTCSITNYGSVPLGTLEHCGTGTPIEPGPAGYACSISVCPLTTSSYDACCTDGAGAHCASPYDATVTVNPETPPSCSLSAFPSIISTSGQSVTLSYSSTQHTWSLSSCSISPTVGSVTCNTSSTASVSPTGLTTYTLTATDIYGNACTAHATVFFNPAQVERPSFFEIWGGFFRQLGGFLRISDDVVQIERQV